ncbi:MAG: sbp 2 [Planctomycetaceae bacterium]|nr:sbp 2 [Planctomycetaceae bacterium]
MPQSWKPVLGILSPLFTFGFFACSVYLSGCSGAKTEGPTELLNASYDPTRELWGELNAAFIPQYEKQTGTKLEIKQSHAGSGAQARAILDGLQADVATLSLWSDTNALYKKGKLIKENWTEQLPNRSLPYTSTVLFVVRKGNPKGIKDWSDLAKPGIEIITPSPKTSGNGKLSFLAAWGSVTLKGGTEDQAKEFVTTIYQQTPVLDTGARGATTTFSKKKIGDVHLTMESEAYLEVEESKGDLEIVFPSISILHEPHITVVDDVVERKKTRAPAEAYLKFLYTEEGQEIIAKHHFRPTDPKIYAKHKSEFHDLKLFPITDLVQGWDEAQAKFFDDGGVFDQVYQSVSEKQPAK